MNTVYLLSFIIILPCFLVTERNAKHVLSGYNSLPEQERKQFDLSGFLRFFRSYLFSLALSYLVIAFMLQRAATPELLIIQSALYPLIGLYGLVIFSSRYYPGNRKSVIFAGAGGAVIIGIVISTWAGVRPAEVVVEKEFIRVGGPFGETIFYRDIIEVEKKGPVESARKIKGFQLGRARKGIFEIEGRGSVKIISVKDSSVFIAAEQGKYILDYDKDVYEKLKSEISSRNEIH